MKKISSPKNNVIPTECQRRGGMANILFVGLHYEKYERKRERETKGVNSYGTVPIFQFKQFVSTNVCFYTSSPYTGLD